VTLTSDQPTPDQPQPDDDLTQQYERNLLLTVQAFWRLERAIEAWKGALEGALQ